MFHFLFSLSSSDDFPHSGACLLIYPRAHVSKTISHGFWNNQTLPKAKHKQPRQSRYSCGKQSKAGAPLLLWSIKLLLIPTLMCSVMPPAEPDTQWALSFLSLVCCENYREGSGGLDSRGCPRMVGSEKHWTVCRIYLEGCEIFSSFVLFFFSFNLTISLSLSPDCIRIDCNLSKCLLWLSFVPWFREHALWYIYILLSFFSPHETEHSSCLLLLLFLWSTITDNSKNETFIHWTAAQLNVIRSLCALLRKPNNLVTCFLIILAP